MSQLELFEERAAICEYEGGLSRDAAEALAAEELYDRCKMTLAEAVTYEAAGWSCGKALRHKFRTERWIRDV